MLFWWSWTGLNRRPPACKAGALPAELQPLQQNPARMSGARNTSDKVVGLERLELSTSRLSGVRSNHLSYRPPAWSFCILAALRCAFALVMYFFVHSLRQKLAFLARIQKSRRSVRQGKPRSPVGSAGQPDLNILSILKEHESLIESEQRVGSS